MSRKDFYASPFGAAYSAYMERPHLSRLISRVVWGGDIKPYYESMDAVTEVAEGGTIVDCPCGAGPALRALRPDAEVRYVAADLSPAMLRRARKRAVSRGLGRVEFIEANAVDLPLRSGSPSLPTSRETRMIRELLNPEGVIGARDVVDQPRRSRRPCGVVWDEAYRLAGSRRLR